MTSDAISIIEELSSLSKKPNFNGDGPARARALALTNKLSRALQKPEDAAMEICFYVGFQESIRHGNH